MVLQQSITFPQKKIKENPFLPLNGMFTLIIPEVQCN
jgi:hypothetical protein